MEDYGVMKKIGLEKSLEMLYKHSIELGMSIDEVEDMLNRIYQEYQNTEM